MKDADMDRIERTVVRHKNDGRGFLLNYYDGADHIDHDDVLALLAASPPARSTEAPASGDARLNGVDGDELLRDWLDRHHNPLGSEMECAVAELVRRALVDDAGRRG